MRTITSRRAKRITRIAAALAMTICAPTWAQVTLPSTTLSGTRINEGARAMLYWRMPLQGWQPQAAQYGLRLDSAPVRFGTQVRSLPLVDVGFGSGRTTVKTLGAVAFDSSDLGTTDSLKNPWFWLGTTLVVLGISCATEHFPCHKNEDGSGTYSAPGDGR